MPGPKGTITVDGDRKIARECEEGDATYAESACTVITHKYRGSQQFSSVEYSTQIYWFDTWGAKEYSQVLAAELSIQPHVET